VLPTTCAFTNELAPDFAPTSLAANVFCNAATAFLWFDSTSPTKPRIPNIPIKVDLKKDLFISVHLKRF
jgi:hypothetical protein